MKYVTASVQIILVKGVVVESDVINYVVRRSERVSDGLTLVALSAEDDSSLHHLDKSLALVTVSVYCCTL